VIAVHDQLSRFRELTHELKVRRSPAKHRVDALGFDLLLPQGAGQKHIFIVVVGRNDQVGLLRLDLQRDVGEIAGRVGVLDHVHHFDADSRKLLGQKLRSARTKERFLMHDHRGLGRRSGRLVDGVEIAHRHLRYLAVAGAEAEGVGQTAADDRVGHADIDHMRGIRLGRFLRCRKRNRRGIAGNEAVHAGLGHLGHLGSTDIRLALAIGEHRLDHGAAHRLDAACSIDIRNRHFRTGAALRTGKRDEARNRMDQADLHRRRLRPQHRGKSSHTNGKCRGSRREKFAAANC